MRELSLFTGAGGGVLGTTLLGWTHIGYVEWDNYCQKLLRQRMEDGYIETAPIFSDIRAFISEGYAAGYQGMVDVITAGFPCQPFSVAGKQGGEDDSRNMWPSTIECIRIIRPRYALLENVPGLLTSGYFGRILGDLAESGYDVRWRVLSAAEVGAPHKRDRLWIMAHARCEHGAWQQDEREYAEQVRQGDASKLKRPAKCNRKRINEVSNVADTTSAGFQDGRGSPPSKPKTEQEFKRCDCRSGRSQDVADTEVDGIQGSGAAGKQEPQTHAGQKVSGGDCTGCGADYWTVEPDVGRVANGVANRVDRLKAIGNGQVPAVVAAAWKLLTSEDYE